MKKNDSPMWEKFPGIWNTQSKYMSWVRGGIRRGLWNKSPVKLEFLKSRTFLTENTNPRSKKRFPQVKMCKCDICGETFKSSEVEVDHIKGNNSLKTMNDIQQFIESIIEVDFSMLQIACIPCHKDKTLAERKGISLEEARATKKAAELIKTKQDKTFLEGVGVVPASNQKARKTQIIKYLMETV